VKRATSAALIIALATPALAQYDIAQSEFAPSGTARADGAEFFGFKTYWADKPDGCRPAVSFKVKNVSSAELGMIGFRMDVLDKDQNSVFADASASVAAGDLPPGQIRDVAIGVDRAITPRDCRGDMHQSPLSGIHFSVRLIAKIGADPNGIEILPDEPMTQIRVPTQN
jgi:hypothetical protein